MSAPVPVLAVLGNPISHSLSPVMHEAAFAATGRPGRYIAFAVPPDRLPVALAGMAALGFVGCNITVGLKEAACALATHRSAAAAATGSANTLRFGADGEIYADTTDGRGLLASLRHEAGWRPEGQSVLLLGAGGAARGIAQAFAAAGAEVAVHNRTAARAERLAADLGLGIRAVPPDALPHLLPRVSLLVNSTTVGMGGEGLALAVPLVRRLPSSALVCDIVYSPEETALLRAARDLGLPTLGGLGMLAWQAALAWEVWFATPGPAGVMLAAARQELRRRQEAAEGSAAAREKDPA